jgi:hypothetical protein
MRIGALVKMLNPFVNVGDFYTHSRTRAGGKPMGVGVADLAFNGYQNGDPKYAPYRADLTVRGQIAARQPTQIALQNALPVSVLGNGQYLAGQLATQALTDLQASLSGQSTVTQTTTVTTGP